MIISERGKKIIMDAEGCRLTAYRCPANVLTIGFGHTGDVKEGQTITMHQAETILAYDLERFEAGVSKLCPKLTGSQFSACVSLAFNIGLKAFENSSVRRKANAGDIRGAADSFLLWNKGGGKVLPGLVKRRAAERALFLEVAS